MCGSLPPVKYRLRVGERRGIGPWEDSYFKREPNDEETRQDLEELQVLCAQVVEQNRRIEEASEQRRRAARQAQMEALADTPIPAIEGLMGRVRTDPGARQRVIALIEALDCDDPRKRRYRTMLANRLM